MIGTIGGALIGSLSTALIAFLSHRSEERKHLRQLIIGTAVENWKQSIEVTKFDTSRKHKFIVPLDNYIIHMMKLSELVNEGSITPEKATRKLREIEELVDTLVRYRDKKEAED